MSDIGRIIEEGEAPHSADYISLWLSSTNLGFIVAGEDDECELSISGNDITVGDGDVYFGDIEEIRSFSKETITISASAESGHRYDLLAIRKDNGGTELVHKQGTRTEYDPEVGDIPKHPDISHPASELEIPIAVIYFEPNDSNITQLKDSRSIKSRTALNPHDNDSHDPDFLPIELKEDGSFYLDAGESETILAIPEGGDTFWCSWSVLPEISPGTDKTHGPVVMEKYHYGDEDTIANFKWKFTNEDSTETVEIHYRILRIKFD